MAIDHETIGRKCLPIFGWIAVVEGYIALFGGTLTCLLLGIIYFAQPLPALASGILFGGVPGCILEGLGSIALGDLMIRFDEKASTEGVIQRVAKVEEAVKESGSKPQEESQANGAPSSIPDLPSGFAVGKEVTYQDKKGTIVCLYKAMQSAAVKFADQSVEVIPLKSLTLL